MVDAREKRRAAFGRIASSLPAFRVSRYTYHCFDSRRVRVGDSLSGDPVTSRMQGKKPENSAQGLKLKREKSAVKREPSGLGPGPPGRRA